MPVGLAYPHIQKSPDEPARLERMPRIRVAQIVMDHLAHGWSAEEIRRQHPYLTLAEAHAALAYYYDHTQEIDHEIQAEWARARREAEQARQSPFLTRMRAKGLSSGSTFTTLS